jgi:L-seryl-tRNA(Ser) seleniumtransferase
MAEIAGQFIPLEELHTRAGELLASIIGVEAALVTAAAAAALTLAVAACIVRDDDALASRLPLQPPKHKVIIQCSHRNPFERALQLAGAELVQIGDAIRTRPEDLESEIQAAKAKGDNLAAVSHFLQGDMLDASLELGQVLEIAHKHHLPVIVDAAAELPPKHHLWSLAAAGADLVIFSGSKDLRGPQTSGLMVGRADLIASARRQSAPHEHVVGRPMKAGKGIVAGMVAAVEHYLVEDEAARFAEWETIANYLKEHLSQILGLQVRRIIPNQPFIQPAVTPRLALSLQEGSSHTAASLKTALWAGDPRIAVETVRGDLWINVHTLTMPEAEEIVQRVKEIYS